MDENEIIPYIEPIYRFCCKRLSKRYDAEDLASEIFCHILDGMKKYEISSLDAWVWRIAHNRYARFINTRNKSQTILAEDETLCLIADREYWHVDEEETEQEYETVFRYLHTLSAEYRDIFIDYYIGELPIRELSRKYSLPETTIKWRLNVGRRKIKERIGEHNMEKVYKRINWETKTGNGAVDTDRYLHTQLARAICQAVYRKPLTVEEISISTGIPALYIEDELPRLEYGDAVCKIGNKYATNFIIFTLQNRKDTEGISGPLVKKIADKFADMLENRAQAVSNMGFYGHDFGMDRLGYIVIPYILGWKIETLKNDRLHLESGLYPPRKDGGYGWFIVEETVDENENLAEYNNGCAITGVIIREHDDGGNKKEKSSYVYYYWIAKYLDDEIYGDRGTYLMCERSILKNSRNGIIKRDALSDEDAASLIQNHLIEKNGDDYKLRFACFTEAQFAEFASLFEMEEEQLDNLLIKWIAAVRESFAKFVPERLEGQINQWVSGYLLQMVGYVTDELIRRGVLRKPDLDKPLTDGVLYVEGKEIHPWLTLCGGRK